MTLVAEPKAPVRAPHPLRAEAVRGFAPFAGAAVLLTLGVLLAASANRWQGGWADTATELHSALLITVPLAAAAGCWQGGRDRRRGTEELWATGVRPSLARFLASALPVAAWVVLGQLAAVGLAMLATWPFSQGDRPHLALLPGDTMAMAAAALAGHVVGRAVATRLAAPLLAVAGYVGLGVLTAGHGSGRHLNPASPIQGDLEPMWWQPAAMAVWTGGLALALVLAHAARRRITALLPLVAALAAGVLLVGTGDGPWQVDPLARHQVCDTSTVPAVCVNARYAGMLPQVSNALSGVTGKLKGVRNLPVRWADRRGGPRPGEVQMPMLRPFGWSVVRGRLTDPEQYAWEAVAVLEGREECDKPRVRVLVLDEAVEHYLAPSPSEAYFDDLDAHGTPAQRAHQREANAARDRLTSMSDRERTAWLSAYFATAGRCDTTGVPSL